MLASRIILEAQGLEACAACGTRKKKSDLFVCSKCKKVNICVSVCTVCRTEIIACLSTDGHASNASGYIAYAGVNYPVGHSVPAMELTRWHISM